MDKYEQIEKMAELKKSGILTEEEFIYEKNKILRGVKLIKGENLSLKKSEFIISDISNTNDFYDSKDDGIFSTFFSVRGRINRTQYILYNIYGIVIVLLVSLFIFSLSRGFGSIGGIFWIYISFVFTIKRLHDIDRSGWYSIIPIYNIFVPLFVTGDLGNNRYGPPPK